MIPAAKRGNVLLTAVLAAAASGFGAGRAEAQWGMAMGHGLLRGQLRRSWSSSPAIS